MSLLLENISRIKSLMEIKDDVELDESDLSEEGEEATDTTTDTTTDTGSSITPWESGVTRGPANQVGVTKWSDVVGANLKRGKANPLMASGQKWETGLTRGSANQIW